MADVPEIEVELIFVGGALDGGRIATRVPGKGVGLMKFPIHNGTYDKDRSPAHLAYTPVGGNYRWETYVVGRDPGGTWIGIEKNLYEKLNRR